MQCIVAKRQDKFIFKMNVFLFFCIFAIFYYRKLFHYLFIYLRLIVTELQYLINPVDEITSNVKTGVSATWRMKISLSKIGLHDIYTSFGRSKFRLSHWYWLHVDYIDYMIAVYIYQIHSRRECLPRTTVIYGFYMLAWSYIWIRTHVKMLANWDMVVTLIYI